MPVRLVERCKSDLCFSSWVSANILTSENRIFILLIAFFSRLSWISVFVLIFWIFFGSRSICLSICRGYKLTSIRAWGHWQDALLTHHSLTEFLFCVLDKFLEIALTKNGSSNDASYEESFWYRSIDGLYRDGYKEALGKLILKRIFLLVLVLDKIKNETALDGQNGIDGLDGGSPLLFQPNGCVKSSRQALEGAVLWKCIPSKIVKSSLRHTFEYINTGSTVMDIHEWPCFFPISYFSDVVWCSLYQISSHTSCKEKEILLYTWESLDIMFRISRSDLDLLSCILLSLWNYKHDVPGQMKLCNYFLEKFTVLYD